MEATQVERQCFGFGTTSTFSQLTRPPGDGAVRYATGPTTRVAFGRFQVLPHRRELLGDGQPIRLGGRAFDALIALIEARGTVLSKGALMEHVWPDRIVEESNLKIQISALRGALGADRELIRTITGRGYQFTGEITTASAGTQTAPGAGITATAINPPTNLKEPLSDLIGRKDNLAEVLRLVAAHRLVALTGPAASERRDSCSNLHANCCPNSPMAFGSSTLRRFPIPAWFPPRLLKSPGLSSLRPPTQRNASPMR